MISLRKLEAGYKALLKLYPDKPSGEVENYHCQECDYKLRAEVIDEGTTPMAIPCPKCGSRMYATTAPVDAEITKEWYRPSWQEVKKFRRKDTNTLEHVLLGGLLLRDKRKEK